jgi:hypothetical protein
MRTLCENSTLKPGAGYQPAAAHRAVLVFNTERLAGSRLRAGSPPHTQPETCEKPGVTRFCQSRLCFESLGFIKIKRAATSRSGHRRSIHPDSTQGAFPTGQEAIDG